MRDTILFLLAFAIVIAIFAWFPQNSSRLSNLGAMNERNQHPVTGDRQRDEGKRRGEGQPVASERAHGTSADASAEGEAFNSIYASKKLKIDTKLKKSKVVHGVPLEAFVQGGRDTLPAEVSSGAPGGVRVFLQCMELRPGSTQNLTEKECKELAAANPTTQRHPIAVGGF